MPALFFPNLDTLRLALVSGLVPTAVARGPARAGFDAQGRLWLEPDDLLSREALTALGRLGVVALGSPGVPTHAVHCWAEILPLRRTESKPEGSVLFDVPDRLLATLFTRLQRRETPVGVRLLPDPHVGRAWVTALAPPTAVFLWLEGVGGDVATYRQQAHGVWTASGWEHPLAAHLAVADGSVLLCGPDRVAECFQGPVPEPRLDELPLRPRPVASHAPDPPTRFGVRLRLARRDGPRDEILWVLTPNDQAEFEQFCRTAEERLLRRFEVATVEAGAAARLIVRRADAGDGAAVLPVAARGYQPDPRLPSVFAPAGYVLRPVVRLHELARELSVGADRIVWLEPTDTGVAVHTVALAAFQPLQGRVEYTAPPSAALVAEPFPEETFGFDRFALQIETSIEIDPEPEPSETPQYAEEPPADVAEEGDPGWMSKSVARMVRWVRGQRQRAERDPATATGSDPTRPSLRKAPHATDAPEGRVERKLASADALLHGHDWAARRNELESRLLADFPRLGPDARAARWAELAAVYGATGQAMDATVCWTNALWECANPPESWLEQWAAAECRAASRGNRGADLDRWLGEPGRPGTGRVVAALAACFGFHPSPPAEFVAALPRVLAMLEQQFDDIPVRAAWLARLAVARVCAGDVLGLARWRDRLIRRLHDRGPALDLDEPSFLRFRGTATAERFKKAREWLIHMQEPVRQWVQDHARGSSDLQWAGLDGEGKATAAYAQFMLAWGLGALGERARSREWAAWARKSLARATGPGSDPAGHAFLGDLFLYRIKEAHEGHTPKSTLSTELQERLEKLPRHARYSADRLREHCRVIQPVGQVRAYRGLDIRWFWGTDELSDRLDIVHSSTDPAQLNDEARALLAIALNDPTTATVPRIVFALLDVAAALDESVLGPLLELVPAALDWMEAWVQAVRKTDATRADRGPRMQSRMIKTAFAVAPAPAVTSLLGHLTRGASAGPLLAAVTATAPCVFRAARKFALSSEADALIRVLDPAYAEETIPVTAERVGLAVGWFVAGDEEAGNRILDAARNALFYAPADDPHKRTALAIAYAEALGFAPAGIALGRLEELFQRLGRVTVHGSSNCYFTLQPLRLVDAVVRAVVTDEFTVSPGVRAWLDGDEFLIRRRVHRDMAALLRESDLG